ncbi:MAG TPA: hypothetical protein VLG69_02790, partial [Candidatus Andersenbacteria bacterium]|nr:hypothetical protein [Candidatus Andersenbacteria bacterium]
AALYASLAIRIPLISIFIGAIILYAPYTHAINGVFGGDAFNYLFKTYSLLHGHDPFAADPRKGPFFSLLLIPALFIPDPLLWSRWVGIIAAAATAALVPLVTRKIGTPWPIAVMAGVLTAENSFLIFESADALAVTTFTFLLLLSVYCYLAMKKSQKWIWALAVSSGLAMLTRFEGGIVAAVLLPAAWIRYRISWKKIVWPIGLAVLIMALPLSSFLFSGKSGIRTPQDISNDDGLFLVHSIHDEQLALNIQRSYEFFTNVWVEKGDTMQIAFWVGMGIVIGCIVILLKHFLSHIAPRILLSLGIITSLGFLFLLAMNNEINRAILVASLYILVGIGIALFIRKKPIDGIAIACMLLAEIMIVIWILPKDRYFLFTVPFLYLFLVYAIHTLVPAKKKIAQFFAVFMMCIAAVFFFQANQHYLQKKVEAYNNNAQETDVLLKALIDLRASNAHVGALDDEGLAVTIYIKKQNLFIFNQTDISTADQELQFIRDNHIQYIMERDTAPQWKIARSHPELFSPAKIYTTKNGDAKVVVYQVK